LRLFFCFFMLSHLHFSLLIHVVFISPSFLKSIIIPSEKSNPFSTNPANFQLFIPFYSSLKLALTILFYLHYPSFAHYHQKRPQGWAWFMSYLFIYLFRVELFCLSNGVCCICVAFFHQKSGKAECCGLAACSPRIGR
jgi:hypothetical protein